MPDNENGERPSPDCPDVTMRLHPEEHRNDYEYGCDNNRDNDRETSDNDDE